MVNFTQFNTTLSVDDGSSGFRGIYSYGSTGSSDRALGSLAENGALAYGAEFVNNTGFVLPTITLTYTAERWRTPTGGVNSVIFTYGFASSGISSADYLFNDLTVQVIPLNMSPPSTTATNQALDGNAVANRTLRTTTLVVNWNPGDRLFIRWVDLDNTGQDAGMAIDDFSLSTPPVPEPAAGALVVAGAALALAFWRRRRLD